jgi:hypothetical protein
MAASDTATSGADWSDAELIDAVGQLHGVMVCAHRQLLRFVAEYEYRKGYVDDGARNMAEWLTARLGISYPTAKRWVRVATKLDTLPAIAAAFEAGRLSFEQVTVLIRMADVHNDAALAELAQGRSVAELEVMARHERQTLDGPETEAHGGRRLWWKESEDHSKLIGGFELPVLEGTRAVKALTQVAEAIPADPITGVHEPFEARCADALAMICSASLAEARADRATVVIHADARFARGDHVGSAEMEEGAGLCHSSLERQLCDCHLEIIVAQPDGSLGIGRRSRSVPRWLERRIRRRDHGCRFPGCGLSRWTQIHHMAHWAADNGETNEANLITVCLYHHHFLHEQHWAARGDPNGVLEFVSPPGTVLKTGPPPLRPETLAA